MHLRTFLIAAAALAAATGAWAQNYGQPAIDRSSERVVFFSGQVMLDNGSPPPDQVRIERVCNGRQTFEAFTDAKGRFGFKISAGGADAAGDATQAAARPADLNKAINESSSQYSNPITTILRDCELAAVLSGFESERVKIALKSTMDSTDVGTILLHPLSRASALTVSATTLEAPANARKAYEKGLAAAREQKWDAASAEFAKAVKIYPRFAVAWYELGLTLQKRSDLPGAIAAWKEAIKSDSRYVKPYENLTVIADQKGNWEASAKYSHDWIQLDPEDFPGAYLFNAIASARLNKMDEAERVAREGLRIDKDHKVARLDYVLGLILMQKKEYSESAKLFHAYLELAPNAGDAAIVRQQLPQIEQAAAASGPPR